MPVSVISTYYPKPAAMEEVIDLIRAMYHDANGEREGSLDHQLFVCHERHKIVTISYWASREAFEDYMDACVAKGELMEIQSSLMDHEIETDVYSSVPVAKPRSKQNPKLASQG